MGLLQWSHSPQGQEQQQDLQAINRRIAQRRVGGHGHRIAQQPAEGHAQASGRGLHRAPGAHGQANVFRWGQLHGGRQSPVGKQTATQTDQKNTQRKHRQ